MWRGGTWRAFYRFLEISTTRLKYVRFNLGCMTLHVLHVHIQVLYESEALEVNENNELSKLLTSYTEGIVSNAFPPEVLGCPDDKITVNTSMIASCLSTLDSRYLYVLVKATSSCRNKATIFEKSTWKATINMITEEIELDDLCGFR